LVCDGFSLPNKRYANVCDHPRRRLAMQQCVVLPSESFDRIPGSDKVSLNSIL
jgi:hypothetical protein